PGVEVNPFAMTVTVSDLAARDGSGEPVLQFDRLHLDLGFLQLFRGIIAFDAIELETPFVRTDLLDGYGVNFIRDWQSHNQSPQDDGRTPARDEPPKLYFGRVVLTNGELLLRDFSQEQEARFEVESLNVTLNDLATFSREGNSPYRFNAVIGDQSVSWDGELTLAPFTSRGKLEIADISHTTLAHFTNQYLPYELRSGRFTLTSEYSLSIADRLQVSTSNGVVNIRDLALGLQADDENTILTLAEFNLDDIGFDLGRRQLDLGVMDLVGARAELARNADGQINILAPFASGTNPEQGSPAADQDDRVAEVEPWRWSLETVQLRNSALRWRDALPAAPADMTFSKVSLDLTGLSHDLAAPVRYKTSLAVSDGGRLSAQGQASIAPFTLEAGLSGDNLALIQANPYVQQAMALDIQDGWLDFDGDLNLDHQVDPWTGTFSGRAEVTSLELAREANPQKLLTLASLRLAPIEYNLAPGRLEVGTLTLTEPQVAVQRSKSGKLNLADIAKSDPARDSNGDDTSASQAPLIFRIGEVALNDGTLTYADRSLEPTLATRLHQLTGSVYGVSNVAPQEGRLNITGKVDDRADLQVQGSLAALGSDRASTLELTLEQMGLTTLSPYFARFLGYSVDGGKLALDLNYALKGSQVTGSNRILFDRLELGPAVASDQAVNAPIKLGLALLRDSQDQIELNLPVEGDLSDPGFQIHRIVGSAFMNLVVKAATSPFSMLGSIADLAGLNENELGAVGYKPGSVSLGAGEADKLKVLAEALSERPKLALDLRGAAAPALDGPALLREALFEDLEITAQLDVGERKKRLEQAYQEAGLSPSLDRLRADKRVPEETQEWLETLISALTEARTLPDGALRQLARSRGDSLFRLLLQKHKVAGEQLYKREANADAPVDSERQLVMAPFELKVR
ncbi:MAG: DUF748 domain-containing protein, partial [Oleiphilaceae bacterium]|nr:DUF748 domain-containing protein [Oleiphilaceae bacterium]